MAELECIEPSERFGRVHSRVVEVRTAPASRHLYHDEAVSEDEYTSEWRLHLITLALSMDIFLVQESSIVSTPIVSTTNELIGFDEASWGSAAPF
ncbi:hypothetical protein BCIN_02g07950 [Botrytis cinerea B05.10]|uniref:Uncharacterized protein n=1 Tax=Botryotinia fuckeliana (strain B05.10) TaxID=332648 RepID=A0A384JAD9_BOTFB|nr:hypothetical protein BCIN_02g07950 [Botrytis cinerea B05.10]ATZ47523.1 hypothetical protein BCIN_02g07950 [Botrytis cinerea B05.10]